MKFGKSLSNQIEETLPDWRDKFLSYKDLKKRLKRIPAVNNNGNSNKRVKVGVDDVASTTSSLSGSSAVVPDWTAITSLTEEEADFMSLLQAELDKFNSFFLEKEEEYVIRQKELQDRMAAAVGADDDFKEQGAAVDEELMKIQKEIVDFHGEMVLLENYSALNYTGLVKILKKYDKRTGALLRLPFIQNVLQQPFFMTDLLYKLIKECESMLDRLFPVANNVPSSTLSVDLEDKPLQEQLINGDRGSTETSASSSLLPKRKGVDLRIPELEEIEYMESVCLKSTVSALRVLKEIRKGSSTVGVFSLPPLQQATGNMDEDRRWPSSLTSPVLEQATK